MKAESTTRKSEIAPEERTEHPYLEVERAILFEVEQPCVNGVLKDPYGPALTTDD